MADEIICGWSTDTDHDGGYVSAVAGDAEDWGVVSEHGIPWVDWIVLRNGYIPVNIVLRDGIYGAARVMAVSQSF